MSECEYFSLRELVVDAGFDLELLTGDVGLDRAVEGIHLSDYEDPTPWMIPGSVLLTIGTAFAGSSEAAVRFVEKVAAAGTVALGVGAGQHGPVDRVAPEMVQRAVELRLPLFVVNETVPFRAIFAYVYNALASNDMHYLRRALSVQALLLDLLIDEKGIREVLSRLASILDASLLLSTLTAGWWPRAARTSSRAARQNASGGHTSPSATSAPGECSARTPAATGSARSSSTGAWNA